MHKRDHARLTCIHSSNPPPSHACTTAAGRAHPLPPPTSICTTVDPAACEQWWLSADTWLLLQITLMSVVLYLLPAPAYPDLYWTLCAANGHAAAEAIAAEGAPLRQMSDAGAGLERESSKPRSKQEQLLKVES